MSKQNLTVTTLVIIEESIIPSARKIMPPKTFQCSNISVTDASTRPKFYHPNLHIISVFIHLSSCDKIWGGLLHKSINSPSRTSVRDACLVLMSLLVSCYQFNAYVLKKQQKSTQAQMMELCKCCTGSRLRFAVRGHVTIPRTRLRFTDRSFAAAGSKVWNAMPSRLRSLACQDTFHRHLKTQI